MDEDVVEVRFCCEDIVGRTGYPARRKVGQGRGDGLGLLFGGKLEGWDVLDADVEQGAEAEWWYAVDW